MVNESIYDCPPQCGGCSCHNIPPCTCCTEHFVADSAAELLDMYKDKVIENSILTNKNKKMRIALEAISDMGSDDDLDEDQLLKEITKMQSIANKCLKITNEV